MIHDSTEDTPIYRVEQKFVNISSLIWLQEGGILLHAFLKIEKGVKYLVSKFLICKLGMQIT